VVALLLQQTWDSLNVWGLIVQQGQLLTPEIAGAALVELVQADAGDVAPAYGLNGAGLRKLP
jgi:3-oxoacyl-[acyl-carrier protein] reductase